jgi:hypothetical protein
MMLRMTYTDLVPLECVQSPYDPGPCLATRESTLIPVHESAPRGNFNPAIVGLESSAR